MAAGQTKSKEDPEKEAAIRKSIDAQKRSMAAQQKALDEQSKSLQKKVDDGTITEQEAKLQLDQANKDFEVMKADYEKGLRIEAQSGTGDPMRVVTIPRGSHSFSYSEPFLYSDFFGRAGGDSDRTTWDLSKSVKEGTFSKDYSFEVDKTTKTLVMSVNGDCKSGEFRIKILLPSGKSYSDIVIDEFGNLNWRKSFNISETENQDKTGTWKFQVSSNKATGFFKISLQTY